MSSRRPLGLLLVFVASLLYSTAGLFTSSLHLDPWTILAWRAVYGTLFMLAWVAAEHRGHILRAFRLTPGEAALTLPASLGGICYIFALKLTTVADVMVIYATMPFVTAAVAWVWKRDVPERRTMMASMGALVGVGIMMAGGLGSGSRLAGIGAMLLMNLTFAISLVKASASPRASIAIYTLGTALSGVVGFALAPDGGAVTSGDMGLLALFGVLTIGLAMTLYMVGARMIPPTEVGLVAIVDIVLGPALVWLVFGQKAAPLTIAGGGVMILALMWRLAPDLRQLIRGSEHVVLPSCQP